MKTKWLEYQQQTIKLALPIMGAHLVEALIPFINTTMAASLGENQLAAAGLVGTTFLACMGFCWGIISAVGILTAQQIGAVTTASLIGLNLKTGIITALLLSLPLMVLFFYIKAIWLIFGQNPEVCALGQTYFYGLSFAVFADLAKFALFQFAIAVGKPRIPLIANIISIPLVYLFNNILIQNYGIAGIGIGTALTYWLVFIGMLTYMMRNRFFQQYFAQQNPVAEYLKALRSQILLGLPIGSMFSIELLFFVVIALLMGSISATSLAANQIAMQWMWLVVMLPYGFTEAITILTAKSSGAGEFKKIREITFAGVSLTSICMLIIAMIYWIYPHTLIALDIPVEFDPHLTKLATSYLMLCAIYQLFDCARIVIAGVLRGMGESQFPMWITGIAFWMVALPVGCLFAFTLKWEGLGLWFGLIIAAMLSIMLQYYKLNKLIGVRYAN